MWLERYAGTITAIAACNFLVVALIGHFQFTVAGIAPPDTHIFGISDADLRPWLAGIRNGLLTRFMTLHTFTLDLTLPYMLLAAFTGLAFQFGNRVPRLASLPLFLKIVGASLLPLLYTIADNAENLMVVVLLQWHPSVFAGLSMPDEMFGQLADLLRTATLWKFIFFGLALLVLLATFVASKLQTGKD